VPCPTRKSLAGILLAMFMAVLGFDFLFHAGLMAHFYVHAGPALLPQQQLFRRIPFGYASILLTLAFELWLLCRMDLRGAAAGARFGAVFGAVMGVAGALGLFSLVPLGASFLAGDAVCQVVEYTVAGAIAGSGIQSGRVLRLIAIGFVILVAGFAASLAMQAGGLAPGHTASM
jgi:hypothetical protein